MNQRITTHLTALAAVALLLLGASQALAGGTASDTNITNQATLDFKVGTIDQPQASSNIVDFEVDKKVDLTVVTVDGALVQVTPGATNQVLTFTVTNTGNDIQDINLAAFANANGTADPFGGAGVDNFDATVVGVFVEDGTTALYQPAEDIATYIDELAPDASKTVYIVRDIANTQVDNDMAVYALEAEARVGGTPGLGAALTQTAAGAVTDLVVDILFADVAGNDDTPNDAKHSDRSAFLVVTAQMAVTKTQVIVDTFGSGFAVPGATVTYSIQVDNTGSADANTVVIIDSIQANTTFASNLSCTDGTATLEYSDDNQGTWGALPADITTVTDVRVTIPTVVNTAGTATVSFDVTIN